MKWKFRAEIRYSHRSKQWHAALHGLNGKIVFAGEARKGKAKLIALVRSWFPGVQLIIRPRTAG